MNTNQEIENQKQYMEKVKNIIKDKKLKYTILTMGCQLNETTLKKSVECSNKWDTQKQKI